MAESAPEGSPLVAPTEEVPVAEEVLAVGTVPEEEGTDIQDTAADLATKEMPDGEEGSVLPTEEDQMSKEGQEAHGKPKGLISAEQRKAEKLFKVKKLLQKKKDEEMALLPVPVVKDKPQEPDDNIQDEVEEEQPKETHPRESVHSYHSLHSIGEESGDDLDDINAIINQKVPSPEEGAVIDEEVESVSSEHTPLPRLGHSLKSEFIHEFDSLPSISDISLDSEPEHETEPERDPEKKSSITADTSLAENAEEAGEGESGGSSARDVDINTTTEAEEDDESIEMDDLPDEQALGKQVIIAEEVDTMAMFAVAVDADVELQPEMKETVEEPFWYRLTVDFLNHLINTVVAYSENVDKNKENLLDKEKMILELARLLDDYTYEKCLNTQLNNVVCDYYRRIRKFNNFQPLSDEDTGNEFIRYIHALKMVDNLMERVKLIKIRYGHSTARAAMELNAYSAVAFNEEQRLEGFMRKTLIRRDMDRLKRALDNDLRRMQDLRNQISEKRYELNLNLHTLAFVDEKVMKFERVTETLTISQMLCANESIIQLSKQLEEKCKDVAVMQSNYKKSMIEETCIREKRDMIAYMLAKAKKEYADRFERRNRLRKELTSLQVEHARLKAQRVKLELKGGLLFKVGLMYDYDKCMADIENRRAKIANMKKTCTDLSKRIFDLQIHRHHSSFSIHELP